MSLNLLLEQFDQVIRAPKNLEKLRAAILDWAVRGLLNTQNPNDDPVDELIERIMAQRQAMIGINGNVKPKKLMPIKPSEIPYDLPENWRWVRLPAVYYTHGQKKPDSVFTYIDVSSIDNERGIIGSDLQVIEAKNAPSRARKNIAPGTVIYSTVRPYLLNIAIVEQEYDPQPIVSTAFAVMCPFQGVLNKYLYYYLRSPSFTTFVEGQMTGMAYPAISDSKLNKGLFPLPPIEEQKRIVARVKQLRAQVYELASRLESAESHRKKFHTTVIHQLTEAKTPKETGAAWHLICDNFDRLYTDPNTIDELKQAILQLAVMGRLVPQDPNDETAEVLLERITAEKAEQVEAGIFKKPRKIRSIKAGEQPYGIPSSWTWARLDAITVRIADIDHKMPKSVNRGVKFISAKDLLDDDTINFHHNVKRISEEDYRRLSRKVVPRKGDIIYSRIGARLGKARIVQTEEKFLVSYSCCVIRPLRVHTPYLNFYLDSGIVLDQAKSHTRSIGVPDLGMQKIREFIIAVPPLKEQRRIVAEVDELFERIRDLADCMELAEMTRVQLLDAILAR